MFKWVMFLSVWALVVGGSWLIYVEPMCRLYVIIGLLFWLVVVLVFACRKAEVSGDGLLIGGISVVVFFLLPLVVISEFFGWGEPILQSMTWSDKDNSTD